jgi:oligopeptide transport system substrate-binding protein
MESDMNFTNWDDEIYETYIEASKIASGQDRFELLYKAENILSNSYVVMPIYHYSDVEMISGRVSDLDKTSRSIYYFGQAKMLDVKQ